MNLIWHKRLFNPSRFIKNQKIYILPTFSGIKLFVVNLLLLFVGLIFANNFVLFFDFLLFGLFVCSMFYTHFNLDQVDVVSVQFIPGHRGERSYLVLMIKNLSQLPKTSISLKLPKSNLWEISETLYFDLSPHELREVRLPLKLNNRGVENLERIILNTIYPFNFFKSFTYYHTNCEMVVYPERDNGILATNLPTSFNLNRINEEEMDLVRHENGKSLARIFWKRFALTGELYSRHHAQESEQLIKFDWSEIEEPNLERKLIILTSLITFLEDRSVPWEFKLFEKHFYSKNIGIKNALTALAAME